MRFSQLGGLVLLLGAFACSNRISPTATHNASDMEQPIYEIAVRKVKDGQLDAFTSARSAFIARLKEQEAALTDREFASFYALPAPDDTPVFIGMTQWASAQGAQAAAEVLMSSPEAGAFFSTLDFKAYVMVVPSEGGAFDLSTLAGQPGQVLELAVRRVKEGRESAFQTARQAFVNILDQQEGVLGSWEFQVVGGQDTERLTVGMSVYESQEAFQRIAASVQAMPEAGAYFATFDPVALQYAVSASHD